MSNLIKRQDAIEVVAKSYKYESDRMTALQELPVFNVDAVKEQVCDEIRCIMDTYCGSLPDDVYSELETLEQETVEEIFKACGSYGMRD